MRQSTNVSIGWLVNASRYQCVSLPMFPLVGWLMLHVTLVSSLAFGDKFKITTPWAIRVWKCGAFWQRYYEDRKTSPCHQGKTGHNEFIGTWTANFPIRSPVRFLWWFWSSPNFFLWQFRSNVMFSFRPVRIQLDTTGENYKCCNDAVLLI